MKRPNLHLWASFVLVSLTLMVLFITDMAGSLIADRVVKIFEYRQKYSEAIAVQFSMPGENDPSRSFQKVIDLLRNRDKEILAVALVGGNNEILAESGSHTEIWEQPPGDSSTLNHIQVPLFNQAKRWGTLQIRFHSMEPDNWMALMEEPWIRFLVLVLGTLVLGYFLYIRRTLRELDPSSVIPFRVKSAFDVLVEGVVWLDNYERIVLANRAFGQLVSEEPDALLGKKLSKFGWASSNPEKPMMILPWVRSKNDKRRALDFPMMLPYESGKSKKFRVNCTPITDVPGWERGILVSFSDVTELEETICALESSKAELEKLAMRDPLTGCFNRRALFEAFEDQWSVGQEDHMDLGCIMADIDHFKSFNDRFGHAAGDLVLKVVAEILSTTIRPTDILGRYGGEEFCVLLPCHNCEETSHTAERLRQRIEEFAMKAIRTTSGQRITMSFGVSSLSLGASDFLELVDQADKALYAAKQDGRNQVRNWTEKGLVTVMEKKADLVLVNDI